MSNNITRAGGCHCGATRFEASGEPLFVALCHCPDCRRTVGAPAVGWAMFARESVQLQGKKPSHYASSPGVVRHFCSRCGTSLAYEGEAIPGMIDLTIGAFEQPNSLPPALHIFAAHQLSWWPELPAVVNVPGLPDTPGP